MKTNSCLYHFSAFSRLLSHCEVGGFSVAAQSDGGGAVGLMLLASFST